MAARATEIGLAGHGRDKTRALTTLKSVVRARHHPDPPLAPSEAWTQPAWGSPRSTARNNAASRTSHRARRYALLRAAGSLALAIFVVGACGTASTQSPEGPTPSATSPAVTAKPTTAPPTPTPAGITVEPTTAPPTPTPGPLAVGWPVGGVDRPVIGSDGTAYTWMTDADGERVVAALDTSGAMRPGWPFRVTSGYDVHGLVVAVDGSLLVGIHDAGETGFELHRVGADGRELAGWPFRPDSARYCESPVGGVDGAVALFCIRDDGKSASIVVLDATGRVVPGWPATRDGGEDLGSSWGAGLQLGPDGSVYALDRADPEEGARLWAFAADGSRRPGFPVTLESHWAAFLVAPRDRILVGSYIPPDNPKGELCSEARETILTELSRDGTIVPGWPVTVAGFASRPVIAADGTVYYLTRDRIDARGPDGSARTGWPVAIPPVFPECEEPGPYLSPDGMVFVTTLARYPGYEADGLWAFGPDGQPRPGWPFKPAGGFATFPCEEDRFGSPPPAFGLGGRVYAAVQGVGGTPEQPQIVALDSEGRVVPGWPYPLPVPERGQVEQLDVVDGRLYVSLQNCGESDFSSALLALDPDGTLSD